MSYYRLQDADRDTAELLDPDHQWSQTWGGGAHFVDCEDTDGMLCVDPTCGRCSGTGEYDDAIRRGVSVCPTRDGLADYFAAHNHGDYDAEFLGSLVLVEVDGPVSDDDDHDAADGALLVLPTRIVAVGAVPADMIAAICG